jgi:aminoglycoside 2''-phosphotransferase
MTDLEKQKVFVEAILAACPGIQIRSARLQTHDGEYNDILVVNDDLIFRFPRHAENIPGFWRELQLLKKIRASLPLPIPDPIYTSDEVTRSGKVFMGYHLIPGQPLFPGVLNSVTNEASLRGLAKQLADFLTALHHLTPSKPGLNLPPENMPEWVCTFFSEVREHLFAFMRPDACLALTEQFEHYFNTIDLQLYQPTIIHGDFGGSNILIDNNQISGILDFSSASYSDPALDIASVSTYGEPFFTHICQFYAVTESLLGRAKFYRGIFALEEALYGWKNEDKKTFERGMVQYL